jgi:hypothetical protein
MDGIFQENNIQLVMRHDKSSIVHSLIMVVHLSNQTHYRRNERSKTLVAENLNSK